MKDKFVIAVADDDLDDQELIRMGLSECKINVVVRPVYDGVRLMDFLLKRHEYKNNSETPDLILLDLNMPLMDGFQALKEIRAHLHLQLIPIYVITTSRSERDKEMAITLGAQGFYSKGSSSRDIRRIVRQICNECFENDDREAAEE